MVDSHQGPYQLVLGANPDWTIALEAVSDADCIYCLTLDVAVRIENEFGFRPAVVDVTHRTLAIQNRADTWADGLLETVDKCLPSFFRVSWRLLRRTILLRVFLPIASSRVTAEDAAARIGKDTALRSTGLSQLEVAAFDRTFDDHRVLASARPQSDTPLPSGDQRRAHLPRTVARALAGEILERVRLARVRRQLRRWRGDATTSSLGMLVVMVPVHLQLLDGAIRELRQRGWSLLVLDLGANEDVVRACEDLELPLEPMLSYQWQREPFLQLIRERWLRRKLRTVVEDWAGGVGLSEHLDLVFDGLREHHGHAVRITRAHELIVDAIRPSFALTVSEINLPVEALVPVCKRRDVPTINVQHGSALPYPLNKEFDFDAFCVWGQADAEMFHTLGTPRDRLVVTGDPFMDPEAESKRTEHASSSKLQSSHGAQRASAVYTVLFAGGYAWGTISDESLYATLSVVLEHAERDRNCSVVVKLHPIGEGKELGYDLALQDHPTARVLVTRQEIMRDLLGSCDLVATHLSTAAIEGASLAKPVIVVDPDRGPDILPVVVEGVALRAADAAEFSKCVAALLEGNGPPAEAYARFKRRYSYCGEGTAGSRIADVCDKLARKND